MHLDLQKKGNELYKSLASVQILKFIVFAIVNCMYVGSCSNKYCLNQRYFNGYLDSRSVQENFNLIISFIQDSADKHIPSKTSLSVSSVPWITPAIRRKIHRKNATHAKAKKSNSAKFRAKFETLSCGMFYIRFFYALYYVTT